jgi:3-methyl-2-oxobutanoate hydroxymethyltransferase
MSHPLIAQSRSLKKSARKITALTAYDYPVARLLDESGVDIILVGDSVGMVVLGYPDTTSVTMDDMLHHCRAVARGAKSALVVCDLPIGSCDTVRDAVRNSRRLIGAGAQAVKLEGGAARRRQIAAIVSAGIPVMAHIGMLPQQVRKEGGYKMKGKTAAQAQRLIKDAKAAEKAGAFCVVLELIEESVAGKISMAVSIPTIGIGSGTQCDGQILVTHDLVGLFPWFKPKFVSRRAHVAEEIRRAAASFIEETRAG